MSVKVKVRGGSSIKAIPKEGSTTPIVAPAERKPQIVPDSVVLGIDTIGPYIQRIDAGPGIIVFPEDDVELANVVISHANTSVEISTNNDVLSFTRNVDIDGFGHVTKFYNTSLSSLNFTANGTLIQANDFTIGNTSLTIGESTSTLEGLSSISVDGISTFGSVVVNDLTPDRIVYVGANNQLADSSNFTFDGSTLTTSNTFIVGTLDVSEQSTLASVNVEDLTDGRVVLAGANGEIEDSPNLTFDGNTLTIDGTIDVNSQATVASLNVEDLTATRIVYVGTAGELVDSANLVFDGVSLTATGGVFLSGLEVRGQSTFDSANVLDLTQGRIVYAGADGELVDSANLTFDGTSLTATNGVLLSGLDVQGQTTLDSVNVQDLTPTRIVYVGTDGELIDSANLVFNGVSLIATGGVFLDGLEVQGQSTFGSVNVEDLTPSRIVYVGTDGELIDSANLYFDGTNLTATGGVFLDGLQVQGQSTFGSVNVTDLTQNRIVLVGASGELIDDAKLRFSANTLTVAGDADIHGNLTLGGNLIIGDSPVDTVNVVADFTSDLIPDANDTYSLGAIGKNWKRLFTPVLKSDTGVITIDETGALSIPVGSTGDRPTPVAGMLRYNSTDDRFEGYDNTGWSELAGSVKDVDKDTFIRAETSAGADNDQLDFFNGGTQTLQLDADGSFKYGAGLDKIVFEYATGNANVAGTFGVASQTSLASVNVEDLTSGRVVLAGTNGELVDDGNLTFDGTTFTVNTDFVAGESTFSGVSVLDLVTTGIVTTGPGGELRSTANLSWDGFNLTVVGGISVDGDFSTSGGLSGDSLSVGNLQANTMMFVTDTGALSSNNNIRFDGSHMTVNATSSFLTAPTIETVLENQVFVAGANGALEGSNSFTFDGSTLNVDSQVNVDSLRVEDLTSGRIVLAGTNGELEDDESLTWDGSLLTIDGSADISGDVTIGGNLTLGNQTLDTINVVADFTSDLIPKDDSVYNLGESGSNWNKLYINTIDADSDVVTFDINGAVTLPTGSTGERPTPVQGMIRYNTDDGRFEAYDGSAWTGIGGVIDTNQDTFIRAEAGPGLNNDELEFFTAGVERFKVGNTGVISTDDNFIFVSNNGFYTTVGGDTSTSINGNATLLGLGNYTTNFSGRNTNLLGQDYVLNVGTDITLLAGDRFSLTSDNVAITSTTIDIDSEFISDLIPRDDNTYDLGAGEVRDANGVLIEVGNNWRTLYVRNITSDIDVVKVTANGAFTVPVGTTDDRPASLEAGMVRFNNSDNVFEGYNGIAWASLGGVIDTNQDTFVRAESAPGVNNDELEFFTNGTRRFYVSNTGAITTDANTNLVFDIGINGVFDVGNNIITGVADAVNGSDAVSKNYLDTQYQRDFFVTKVANTYSLDLLDATNPAKLELGNALSGTFDVANNKVTIGLDPVWDSFTGLREAGPEGTVPNFEFDEFGRVRSLINIPLSVSSNAVVDFANSIFDVLGDAVRNGNVENGISVIPDFANLKLDFYVNSFDIDLTGDITGSARVINNSDTVIDTTYDFTKLDDRYLNVTGDTATGDLIAPRFRDSANTVFYADPAGTSRFNSLILGYGLSESSLQLNTNSGFQTLYATGNRIGFLGSTFNFATFFDISDNSWRVEDGSVFSRNFIDSQNIDYRLNPAGPNSRFLELDIDNWLDINNNLTIYDDRIVTASGNLTLNPASGIIDANTSIISYVSDPVNNLDATNKQYVDTEITTAINSFVGGEGLTYTSATQTFDVNVDDSTIEIASDILRVKDAGITNAKLANPNITFAAESGSADAVALGETVTFAAGEGINTTVSANQILIAGELASDTNVGVASFNINNFTVSGAGDVTVTTLDGGTF